MDASGHLIPLEQRRYLLEGKRNDCIVHVPTGKRAVDQMVLPTVSTKCRLQTADCRLQTGYKMQTRYKMQTADCRLGTKCRLTFETVFFFNIITGCHAIPFPMSYSTKTRITVE